ncbi:hypothetical protein Patl1_24678 [Pistacia atlantica]|uniref:Uncharacterized protein n=1 Tax=Pistacia atlantica TaxID=434234 RepID=A0ACC1A2U0_9ROSI|nr:hypothetical protein Patl1_24678 [Pistacia atlantica]
MHIILILNIQNEFMGIRKMKNRKYQNHYGHKKIIETGTSSLSTLLSVQPHQDGPPYFLVVAILTLGSPVVMDFTHSKFRLSTSALKNTVDDNNSNGEVLKTDQWKDNHHPFSILLMPCSLLIFKDDAYSGKYITHGWMGI